MASEVLIEQKVIASLHKEINGLRDALLQIRAKAHVLRGAQEIWEIAEHAIAGEVDGG